jgi:hypothetical protein
MRPVVQLYWLRVVLGIIAGVITAIVALFMGNETDIGTLFNSVSIAIIIYFISYYLFKAFYKTKIEKQSKILSTGIGIYFFTWIALFVLFYTTLKAFTAV